MNENDKQAEPVAADQTGLIKRIDAAIERVTQGRGLMSIPEDPRSDVDLVLSECKALLQGKNPPFWATDFHPAQPELSVGVDFAEGLATVVVMQKLNGGFLKMIHHEQIDVNHPAQPVQDEISRLWSALKKANEQAEHFEREWYLRGDEIEALKAQPVQPAKLKGDGNE